MFLPVPPHKCLPMVRLTATPGISPHRGTAGVKICKSEAVTAADTEQTGFETIEVNQGVCNKCNSKNYKKLKDFIRFRYPPG